MHEGYSKNWWSHLILLFWELTKHITNKNDSNKNEKVKIKMVSIIFIPTVSISSSGKTGIVHPFGISACDNCPIDTRGSTVTVFLWVSTFNMSIRSICILWWVSLYFPWDRFAVRANMLVVTDYCWEKLCLWNLEELQKD